MQVLSLQQLETAQILYLKMIHFDYGSPISLGRYKILETNILFISALQPLVEMENAFSK